MASSDLPLVVVLNSNKVIEYRRDRALTERQTRDLENTEIKMQSGIQVGNEFIDDPSEQDKAIFMANQLVLALENNHEPVIAISCAYLATRYPDLLQVRAVLENGSYSIQLINDEIYVENTPLKFKSKKDLY